MPRNYTATAERMFQKIIPGNEGELAQDLWMDEDRMYEYLSENIEDMSSKEYKPYKTGAIVKQYMCRSGKTERELAALLGVSLDEPSGKEKINNIKYSKQHITRSLAIKLAFFLELNKSETDKFLLELRKPVLHLREYQEVIYAFMLNEHKTYEEAERLINKYSEIYNMKPVDAEDYAGQAVNEIISESHTATMSDEFDKIESAGLELSYQEKEEMLKALLESDNIKKIMSELHATTSKKYVYYVDEARRKINNATDGRLGHAEIFREYMPNVFGPERKEGSSFEWVFDEHKERYIATIFRGNESLGQLYRMTRDVPRMNYILALLIYITYVQWDKWEQEYVSVSFFCEKKIEEEDLEKELRRYMFSKCFDCINESLSECGFPLLNPRCYFDYLILLSIKTEDPVEAFDRLFGTMGI